MYDSIQYDIIGLDVIRLDKTRKKPSLIGGFLCLGYGKIRTLKPRSNSKFRQSFRSSIKFYKAKSRFRSM